jgi:putative membrane protein
MMRILATIAAIVLTATAATAQGKAKPATQKFLTEAIEGNFAEVQMGELAQKNGQSQDVKSFGQMLVSDHSSANQKATEATQSLGVTPPSGPNAKQKADYDKMSKMNGAAFDKMFAQHMIKDHRKDIKQYQKAAKNQDAAGQYAQNALPTLRKHLETAQSLGKHKAAR